MNWVGNTLGLFRRKILPSRKLFTLQNFIWKPRCLVVWVIFMNLLKWEYLVSRGVISDPNNEQCTLQGTAIKFVIGKILRNRNLERPSEAFVYWMHCSKTAVKWLVLMTSLLEDVLSQAATLKRCCWKMVADWLNGCDVNTQWRWFTAANRWLLSADSLWK